MAQEVYSDRELEQMYQEVILDASRNPHGRQALPSEEEEQSAGQARVHVDHEACAASSHQFNPTCGDEVTVRVRVSWDTPQRIEQVIWDGQGCSISQASLSMMVDLVTGKTVDEAMELFRGFHTLMESRGAGLQDEAMEERLDDAVVFQGVSRYPMRIKCALLGWEGFKDATAHAIAQQEA